VSNRRGCADKERHLGKLWEYTRVENSKPLRGEGPEFNPRPGLHEHVKEQQHRCHILKAEIAGKLKLMGYTEKILNHLLNNQPDYYESICNSKRKYSTGEILGQERQGAYAAADREHQHDD